MNILDFISLSATAGNSAPTTEKSSSWADKFENLPVDQIIDKLVSGAVDLVIKLLIAVVIFYVGKLIINKIHRSLKKIFQHRQVDKSLATFVLSLVKIVLLFILIIIVISILGIETSSFIALFASAGVAIGMALSGTLQNFAGGVLILLLKPYKVGDFIEFQGFTGTVKEIQIFNTVLNTIDNKCILIPNGGLSSGSINNYSKEDYRRVDWTVSIAYGDDYDIARQEILRILNEDKRIVKHFLEDDREERMAHEEKESGLLAPLLKLDTDNKIVKAIKKRGRKRKKDENADEASNEPAVIKPKTNCAPFVALSSLGASSVDLTVRVWVPAPYYWGVFYDNNARFYKELPQAGIHFPYPQLDVHMN